MNPGTHIIVYIFLADLPKRKLVFFQFFLPYPPFTLVYLKILLLVSLWRPPEVPLS